MIRAHRCIVFLRLKCRRRGMRSLLRLRTHFAKCSRLATWYFFFSLSNVLVCDDIFTSVVVAIVANGPLGPVGGNI